MFLKEFLYEFLYYSIEHFITGYFEEYYMELNRVNQFLANIEPPKENDIILNGADITRNIVLSEIMDISRLTKISDELLTYLSKDMKRLSRKEQQSFWRDVEAVNARKEDFIVKVAQEANKNEFMKKIFNMASQPTEKVISENGEVYESSITDEQRAQLSTLLVDLMNAANRS